MIGSKKVLAVTLARGGSKSIPLKNIALLNGKPLLEYTIDEVKKMEYIDEYIVSTDHAEISKVCINNKVTVVPRSRELSQDTTTSADALVDAIERIEKKNGVKYDFVIEVMCTNPLKNKADIGSVLEALYFHGHKSVVTVAQIYDHHPSRVKYIEDGKLKDFHPEVPESRRQDLTPMAFVRNGSVYGMDRDWFMKTKRRYHEDTYPIIMPAERTINIDEPMDLMIAEQMIKDRT